MRARSLAFALALALAVASGAAALVVQHPVDVDPAVPQVQVPDVRAAAERAVRDRLVVAYSRHFVACLGITEALRAGRRVTGFTPSAGPGRVKPITRRPISFSRRSARCGARRPPLTHHRLSKGMP